VIEMARRALAQQAGRRAGVRFAAAVKDYLQLHLGGLQHEVFAVLFLDNQHRLISLEELFPARCADQRLPARGGQARAGPAMPAAVILAHNHPSGVAEPSRADEHLTRR
jgi:DNA repair protein RadC